jgi:hypothetical protein
MNSGAAERAEFARNRAIVASGSIASSRPSSSRASSRWPRCATPCDRRRDLLDHAIDEVLLLDIAGHVLKGQDHEPACRGAVVERAGARASRPHAGPLFPALIFTHKSASDSGGQPAFLETRYRRTGRAEKARSAFRRLPSQPPCPGDNHRRYCLRSGTAAENRGGLWPGRLDDPPPVRPDLPLSECAALFRPTLICAQSHFCAKISACGER